MNKEFGTAAAPVTVNPMRLPNTLHLAIGGGCFVLGAWLLLGMANAEAARAMGISALLRLSTGMLILLLGWAHVRVAMCYFRFSFHEGEAGAIEIPANSGGINGYLLSVINNGVVHWKQPPGALYTLLYGRVPQLKHAPAQLRHHAERQLQRAVYLVALLASFGLAWVFAQPAAFAWMAVVYLVLAMAVLKPVATLARIRRSEIAADDRPLSTLNGPAILGLLAMSIAGPLALTLSPVQLPAPPFATATVVLPTIAVLGSALIVSILFIVALIAQTSHFASSGARNKVRQDLQMQDLTRGLLDRWHNSLPWPRKEPYAKEHVVQGSEFHGVLLCETEPVARADQSAGTLGAAFKVAWASAAQRPLLGLSLLGLLLGVGGAVFAFMYARTGGTAMFGLIALSFVSSSQFALACAHQLWNRVDFTSTLYRMSYKGTFRQRGRVLGSNRDTNGTLSDSAVEFGPLRVEVCVAQLESLAFSRDGTRHITAIDLLPEACDQQFGVMADYIEDARSREARFMSDIKTTRQALAEGATPPMLPQPAAPELQLDEDRAEG